MRIETDYSTAEALDIAGEEVVRHKGQVLSRHDTGLSASFAKKFSWLWFLLLAGLFYLPFYWTRSAPSLTMSVSDDGGPEPTVVTLTSKGKRAEQTARAVRRRLR